MKNRWIKKSTALFLCVFLSMEVLTGCAYSNLDEYLEILGFKDSEPVNTDASSAEDTFVITQDSVSSSEMLQGLNDISSMYASSGELTEPEESEFIGEEADEDAADSKFSSFYKRFNSVDLSAEMQEKRNEIGLTADNIPLLKEQQKGLYAYERLTEYGKTLYVELLTIMQNTAENILVSTTSDEAIDLVFDYVMADHPELFYVDGYKYTNYTVNGEVTKVGFTGNYLYDDAEIARRQTLINEYVNKCLAGAPSSDDDYYAIKYVYEYLIRNTEYDIEAEDNQNICSVFIGKRSVCNGYSKAAQYLLNKLGIECTLVTGTVTTKKSAGVRHAWNLVLCNDAYYYMDTTWGDSSYQTNNGENADSTRLPEVNYDYLCVTTQELLNNHTISDEISMPICNSMKDNYYVREDEYFVSPELSLVGELFERRYNDGSQNVVIKCASEYVYSELFEELITQRKVFDYLEEYTSTVSYTTFADTNTIIFWL